MKEKKTKLSKPEQARRALMVTALCKGKRLRIPLPVPECDGYCLELKAKWPGRDDDYGTLTAWIVALGGKPKKMGIVDEELHLEVLPLGCSMIVLGFLNEMSEAVVGRMMEEAW